MLTGLFLSLSIVLLLLMLFLWVVLDAFEGFFSYCIFNRLILILIDCMCMCVVVCAPLECGIHRSQKRSSEFLELKLTGGYA